MKAKKLGVLAEQLFAVAALKRDYNISYVPGDTSSYDLVLDNDGILFRVQVKGTEILPSGSGRIRVECRQGKTKKRRMYSREDCDVIAIYLHQLDSWYLIPVEEAGAKVAVYPDKVSEYKENWSIFEDITQSCLGAIYGR